MELLVPQSARVNQPVRRCLFGQPQPEAREEFLKQTKQAEMEDALRFKQKWNYDVFTESFVEGVYQWKEASSESPVPEVYTKPFSHKCRRRALKPTVGKRLSFADSDEENCDVQYDRDASATLVFVGINSLPHQSPREPVTPKRSECCATKPTLSLVSARVETGPGSLSTGSSLLARRRLTQRRITDLMRIRRRSRPVESTLSAKRARLDRL